MWSKTRSCHAELQQNQELTQCKPTGAVRNRTLPLLSFVRCTWMTDVLSPQCPRSPTPFFSPFLQQHTFTSFFPIILFITIILSGPHAQFGLADTKAEVSTWKRSPSAAKEDGNMKTDGRAHVNDRVLDLQQQCWLQDLTCSALNSLSYLKNQIAPFIPAGWQLRVSVHSPLWFLTQDTYNEGV